MLKLSEHHHSYKLRDHSHTSYAPLIALLAVTGIILGSYTTVFAQSPGPASGSVGLTGIIEGEPPEAAAVIESPSAQARFSTSPITVSGTCPVDTVVEVYKNDIFAGSTICTSQGVFSFDIDLLFGENDLYTKVYDALNQSGPASNEVTVFYDGLPPQPAPLDSAGFEEGEQLLLNTNAVFRGAFPQETLAIPVSIIGGTPPYAVNIQWGDSNNAVVSRNDNVNFNATHSYSRPGTYQVTLQASDSFGRVAFLSVAAIVNGVPDGGVGAAAASSTPNQLLALWPLYVSLVAIVVSFWLGEIREKRLLQKRGPVYKSPLS